MEALPPQEQMNRMLTGYWVSQTLYAAAKLGIADLLVDGPRSADDLAAATNMHAPSLYRLLRAAASVGVFAEDGERRFSLTPLAECLRSDAPQSQRGLAIMNGEEHYRAWGELLYSVQTGKPSFDHLYGMPIFEFLSKNPEPAAVFDEAMVGVHGRETAAMLEAYDFSGIGTLADIGGGNGSLLSSVLQKVPAMRGLLFDLEGVTARAKERLRAAGLADRCEVASGSFFQSVPSGADAYLMRHIIHDWDDERAATILKNVHRAMKPESRLLLVEMIIPPGNDPSFGKLLDLTMLILPGGKERTEAEYRRLFAACGFELTRIVPTDSEISVIEGRKI
ncbi:MAG TPA: methyltransferase [Pirellulaceae bacterium]|jgi:ubiquinone/menaquinone biosynthesis C-methylase UbiE|nr:methyltransferase [Pirellulaceae bacterium]